MGRPVTLICNSPSLIRWGLLFGYRAECYANPARSPPVLWIVGVVELRVPLFAGQSLLGLAGVWWPCRLEIVLFAMTSITERFEVSRLLKAEPHICFVVNAEILPGRLLVSQSACRNSNLLKNA